MQKLATMIIFTHPLAPFRKGGGIFGFNLRKVYENSENFVRNNNKNFGLPRKCYAFSRNDETECDSFHNDGDSAPHTTHKGLQMIT
ncbi:hypothetical protein ACWIUD_05740 [Helicobacter sp. 23-1044]